MSDITTLLGRYESRGGKHWVEIHRDEFGYYYKGNQCGGNLGGATFAKLRVIVRAIHRGYFLPDTAKTPMRRTI